MSRSSVPPMLLKSYIGCIKKLLMATCMLIMATSDAFAQQDQSAILSRVLDNSRTTLSSDAFRPTSEKCTTGTESMVTFSSPSGLVPVIVVGSHSSVDFNTLEFDVFISSTEESASVSVVEYDAFGQFRSREFLRGQSGWHRLVVRTRSDALQVDIFANVDPFTVSETNRVFIDNVQTSVSSKTGSITPIEGNGCEVERNIQPGFLTALTGLILEDGGERQAVDEDSSGSNPDSGDGGVSDTLQCESATAPFPVATTTPGRFYGKLSLGDGVVAPAGGVEITIRTFPIDFLLSNFVFRRSSIEVEVPAGESEVCYSLDFLKGGADDTKQLEFNCNRGCDDLDLVTRGFWNASTGNAGGFIFGTSYPVLQETPVDITLKSADTFKGEIRFPDGFVANGNEQFSIRVEAEFDGLAFFPESYTSFYYPDAGATSIPFTIGVPNELDSLRGWTVSLSCLSCDDGLVSTNTFVTSALGGPLSTEASSAFEFDSMQDNFGIVLTVLVE